MLAALKMLAGLLADWWEAEAVMEVMEVMLGHPPGKSFIRWD